MKHWTRPLKDGGVEFYFKAANGDTMKGSAASRLTYDDLLGIFEQHTGCTLPPPEIKEPRGKAAA